MRNNTKIVSLTQNFKIKNVSQTRDFNVIKHLCAGTELGSRVRGGNSIKRKYYETLRKKIEKVMKFQLVLTNGQQRQKHNY